MTSPILQHIKFRLRLHLVTEVRATLNLYLRYPTWWSTTANQPKTNPSQTIQQPSEQVIARYRRRHSQEQIPRKPVPSGSIMTNSLVISSADPSSSLTMSPLTLSPAGSSDSSAVELQLAHTNSTLTSRTSLTFKLAGKDKKQNS